MVLGRIVGLVMRASGAGSRSRWPHFAELPEPLDLIVAVVTFDAPYGANEPGLASQGEEVHYVASVKRNQPMLPRPGQDLPWRQVPAGNSSSAVCGGEGEQWSACSLLLSSGLQRPARQAGEASTIRGNENQAGRPGPQRCRRPEPVVDGTA